jgi:hypothetical protein
MSNESEALSTSKDPIGSRTKLKNAASNPSLESRASVRPQYANRPLGSADVPDFQNRRDDPIERLSRKYVSMTHVTTKVNKASEIAGRFQTSFSHSQIGPRAKSAMARFGSLANSMAPKNPIKIESIVDVKHNNRTSSQFGLPKSE